MWWFKSCPRCVGDLFERSEAEGLTISCIQCGHYLTGREIYRLKMETTPVKSANAEPVLTNRAA